MGGEERERVTAPSLTEVVQPGVLLRQLRGDEVELGGAEVGEQGRDQQRLLAVTELRHPAHDRLQPPLELQRLHPGLAEAGLEVEAGVGGGVLVPVRERVVLGRLDLAAHISHSAPALASPQTKYGRLGEDCLSSELVLVFL